MNPTPEEKCEDTRCKKCKKGGWSISYCESMHQRSPSPEARVDWEKSYDIICVHLNNMVADTGIQDKGGYLRAWAMNLAKALSAAFEKGREAR
jgi:hypothetical protein